jgi:hypothetical protein
MAMLPKHGKVKKRVFAALLVLAFAGTGCLTVADDEGPILSVDLYWDEEPDNGFVGGTCETAGVEEMEWHLLDANDEEVETNISDARGSARPCYNAIDILGLAPGTYRLVVSGFDEDGVMRWRMTRSAELNVLRFDVAYALDIRED